MTSWFIDSEKMVFVSMLYSLLLIAILVILRVLFLRVLAAKENLTTEERRRWLVIIRNTIAALFITGMVFIWAAPLQGLAITLLAIAVAIVIATKEIILCIGGSFYRVWTQAFTLGDRIEIGSVRGTVFDQDWLSTTVLEIGPGHMSQQYTGRTVTVPNSLFLSIPITNETRTDPYVMHVITVPLTIDEDWQAAERALRQAAETECTPFLGEAKQHMTGLQGKEWLDVPSVDPRVSIQIPELGRINLLLRIPAQSHRVSRIEQTIMRRFLSLYQPAAVRQPAE